MKYHAMQQLQEQVFFFLCCSYPHDSANISKMWPDKLLSIFLTSSRHDHCDAHETTASTCVNHVLNCMQSRPLYTTFGYRIAAPHRFACRNFINHALLLEKVPIKTARAKVCWCNLKRPCFALCYCVHLFL